MAQKQIPRRERHYHPDTGTFEPNPKVLERSQRIKDKADEVIDTIDKILEKNPEEFVKSYVQKGGE